ncbi:hypothetical protein DL96DRAFT_1669627 [Flagelloscypha sp. PMI_526]|nr:hypothetical protein DL96DRAFT_1669627 [Flagelloscypha sp. PMI_526]
MSVVLTTARAAFHATNLVQIDDNAVQKAASQLLAKMRTIHLHLLPPDRVPLHDEQCKKVLDWIFLISTWNFSFWSEFEGSEIRFGIEWRKSWMTDETEVHTGYWSLVAAIDRALEEGIPITDPTFYATCSVETLEHVFRPAAQSMESVPLLQERIKVMREVGSILCQSFGGSFLNFIHEFHARTDSKGSALDLVKMVVETFPCFRDEVIYEGMKVYFWKRPQILVAEIWAAFYPPTTSIPHPIFPKGPGAVIQDLTMFADYRDAIPVITGSREEVSIRSASIVAVDRVCQAMRALVAAEKNGEGDESIYSVVIDMYLWDLAKRVEDDQEREGLEGTTEELIPSHRTRSIWY